MRLNLKRLERILKNVSATCADCNDPHGILFCGECGRHDDDCTCDGCEPEHTEECDMDEDCTCGAKRAKARPHRCALTRALKQVQAELGQQRTTAMRHLHWSAVDPAPLCGTGMLGPGLRVHYTKARKTDCYACRRAFRLSVSRPAKR